MKIFRYKLFSQQSDVEWAKAILSNIGERDNMVNMMPKRIKKLLSRGDEKSIKQAQDIEEAFIKFMEDYNKAEQILGKPKTNFNYTRQTKARSAFEDQFKRSSSNYSSSSWYDDIFNIFNGFKAKEKADNIKKERKQNKK